MTDRDPVPTRRDGVVRLVFDLDGTLSDPFEGIAASVAHALAREGLPSADPASVAHWIGPPLDELLVGITGVAPGPALDRLVAAYRERYAERGWAECRPYVGVADALRALRSEGIALGVCTSKREDFARQVLDLQRIDGLFEFVSGGDVGVPKSHQLGELLRDGLIDRSSVMVGDRAVDLVAARANGLRGVGVLWGYGDRDELEAQEPLAVLAEPHQLASLAGSIGARARPDRGGRAN
jgi:phosphoglycolate phosphatase